MEGQNTEGSAGRDTSGMERDRNARAEAFAEELGYRPRHGRTDPDSRTDNRAPRGIRRTIFQHKSGFTGDWWWHQEHISRLLELEEAMYRWSINQHLDRIWKRLHED